ncbi:MAG: WD40 repeat domain-containing protein [bacterium]
MKSIRIFISSPGDVGKERRIAYHVIKRLQNEFSGRVVLDPYFWEYEPMEATKDFQDNIPSPSDFDILVCILWSRLGTRLHSKHRKKDGSLYESGTEYELDAAIESYRLHGLPVPLVYLNKTEPKFPARPKDVLDKMVDQYYKLEAFLNRWFRDTEEGVWKTAFNEYTSLAEFEERLEKHLKALISHRLPEPGLEQIKRKVTWKESPFRGLRIFDYQHAPIFFGRTHAIDGVLTALRKQAIEGRAFVLVLGMSGGGKSSLVRAGVLPLMVQPGVIEGVGLWRRAIMRPSDASGHLFDALAASLIRTEGLPELASSGITVQDLAVLLHDNPEGAILMIRQALAQGSERVRIDEEQKLKELIREMEKESRAADAEALSRRLSELMPPQARLVLVIDQMEELFTLGLSPEQIGYFIHTIDQCARSGRIFVIATMRSDFYSQCLKLPELIALKKGDGQYDLEKPTSQEIGQMIRQPAAAAGLQFEVAPESKQSLDEVLRDTALKDPAILPLLEFTLEQLYEHRTPQGILTFKVYQKLGGLEGAIACRAEEEFSKLDPGGQESFNKVMRGLVTIGTVKKDTFNRRWALYDELTSTSGAKALVDVFIMARLFMADRDEKGQPVVSVSHEALIRSWPRLKQWVEENQEFLRTRARVSEAAIRWKQENESPDFLLPSGKPLAEAENILQKCRLDLEPELIRFIEISSKRERDRHMRQIRRIRNVAIGMSVLFFLAVAATIVALAQRKKAILTLARSDFQQGTRLLDEGKADRALAYFAHAVRLTKHEAAAVRIMTLLTQRNCPLPKSEFRHESIVTSAHFSPDGRWVVTASWDNTARVWDASTGKPVSEPMPHEGGIYSARFSSDGRWVVTASSDKTARVWDAASGKAVSEPMRHEDSVKSACFSPDGHWVVTASDNTARVWDAASGNPASEPMRHEDNVYTAEFSPDGHWVVTASSDKTTRVWDAATGKPVSEPMHHENLVYSAEFSPDGRWVVTASWDYTARIWDAASGKPVSEPMRHEREVVLAHFSPDGRWVVTASTAKAARVWDAASGKPVSEPLHHEGGIYSASFSPDGRWVVTASWDYTARIWDAASGKLASEPMRHENGLMSAEFSPDGRWVVTAPWDYTAHVWDAAAGNPGSEPMRHEEGLISAEFSPDGRWVLTASKDKTARVWDAASGNPMSEPMRHEEGLMSAEFSPDGRWVLTASKDKTARVWDAASGKPISEPMRHTRAVKSACFSPDSRWVVTASFDQTARVWDAASGKPVSEPMRHEDVVFSARFSPDGRWVATASWDQTARVWDAASGKPISEPLWHEDRLYSVEFSPDGRRVLTNERVLPASLHEKQIKRWYH